MDLSSLAHRYERLNRFGKWVDERKKELRSEFFKAADQEIPDYNLPTTVISVPKKFWVATNMDVRDFVETRFPAWDLIDVQRGEDALGLTLRYKPDYFAYSWEDPDVTLSRSPADSTPDVDWETMELESPDLFEKFAEPVTTYRLNADAVTTYMNQNPSFDAAGFMQRHTIHKPPVLRILAKRKKK